MPGGLAARIMGWNRRMSGTAGPLGASGEASNGEPVQIEMYINGAWTDITAYVMVRDNSGNISITRGRRDEGGQTDHATLSLLLDNRDGRFSPRNPTGVYFGLIGRNQPIRISVPNGIGGKSYRFWGEVSAWPQMWDPTGTDIWVELTASGIIRRLSQGPPLENSPIYDATAVPGVSGLRAYWPCEEASGATDIKSALATGSSMVFLGDSPDLAVSSLFGGSFPLPTYGSAAMLGGVPKYDTPNATQVRFLLYIPPQGARADLDVMIRVEQVVDIAVSSHDAYELYYNAPGGALDGVTPGGSLSLEFRSDDGLTLGSDLHHGVDVRGKLLRVSLEFEESGSSTIFTLRTLDLVSGADIAVSQTRVTTALTRVINVKAFVERYTVFGHVDTATGLPNGVMGHITLQDQITPMSDLGVRLDPSGETAGRRVQRLCSEEGIAFDGVGDLDSTVTMGGQSQVNRLSLMQECDLADNGMLVENLAVLGLAYRTRQSLESQDPQLTLSYPGFNLSEVPLPVEDDRYIQNKVTVTVKDVSATYALDDGSILSVSQPPTGVGAYGTDLSLNLFDTDDASDHAAWRVHLGTVDEARFPQISVNLAHSSFTSNPALKQAVLALRQGDRILVENPPSWLPPDDIDQIILGFEETITHFEHRLTFNCAPASPYRVGFLDSDAMRLDTDGSMQVLMPKDDLSLLSHLYQDSGSTSVANSLMARSVRAAVEEWPDDRRLRVLEIGAGTGGATSHILPQLPAAQTEYTFTDISDIFTAFAEQKFRRFGFLRYATLDIERDPLSQGFAASDYDLVIAANVLHATSELKRTLAHVRGLLAPGGALIMLEGTAPLRFLDLTLGLTEGWWKFSDRNLRPSYPLISAESWKAVLIDSGFDTVATLSTVEESRAAPPQAVIIADVPCYHLDPPLAKAGSWLILADGGGVGRQLGSMLRARGERCTLVFAGGPDQQLAEDEVVIPPGDAKAYRRMLEPFVDDQPPLRGVVHLWCLDENEPVCGAEGALNAALEISCRSALYVAQALVSRGWRSAPALWLGTRGAVSIEVNRRVEGAGDVRRLAVSSLWGLGRVISQEHPELSCSLLDLDVTADEGDLHRLLDEIYHRGPTVEDQIAYRAGYRYLARLQRSRAAVRVQSALVHPDGTYLITGGRGEIGLLVARWLADHGAGNLVLVGRTIGSLKARQAVSDLERTGVRILSALADVSRMQAVADVLEDIKSRMPPLAGVIHAAGVLEDRLIVDHQWDLFEKVFAPKIHGAWNLHVLTREMPLDLFVLFSSASTVFGGPGLGNYVAANRFLDALAEHRRAVGLPGLSLAWGPWDGVGMANIVGRVREGQWSEMGLNPLSPARALEAMRHALQLDAACVSVMSMDWTKFQQRRSSQQIPRFFEHVLQTSQLDSRPDSAFRFQLESAVAADRKALLMGHVRAQVEDTLGWGGGEHVQVKQGFFDIGMDSLRAVELRNRLQSSLHCMLPATLTIKCPTIELLVEYLLKEVLRSESPGDQGSGNCRDPVVPNVLAPIVSKGVSDSSIMVELERLEELLRGT